MRLLIAVFVFALVSLPCFAVSDPIAVTGGQISGTDDPRVAGVRTYKGIPFAAPPVGELRWKEPQAVVAWDGVRACTEYGPVCPQLPYPEGSFFAGRGEASSEDCLYLNVWTGAKSAEEKRPVMVWIHGGALTRGSGSNRAYDGAALAEKGVVVVTVNYRLGPLGYFAHPALSAESKNHSSGNYGVLDQIAALEWVQANIAKFGGDAGRVTIFGESAGSWGVCYLQATPLAKGLFHRAIGESGGVFGVMPYLAKENHGEQPAEAAGIGFAKQLGVEGTDAAALKSLRAKTADEVIAAFGGRGGWTRPNVDGWVFPEEVYEIFRAGKQNDVPVIVGSNADEGTSLTPLTAPGGASAYASQVERLYGELAGEFVKIYPYEGDAGARRSYLASFRDSLFTWQMRTWARMMDTVDSNAYLYFFSQVPPRPDKEMYGAYHAAEIVYAFGNLELTDLPSEAGDLAVSDAMSRYWVNFATTGDPNGEGLPKWPTYSVKDEPYMEFGKGAVKTGEHLLKTECDFFDKVNTNRRQE